MKSTSKVIMGATLVMAVSLAIVLGLVLVLLAELYCSLLLRRRQLRANTDDAAAANTTITASISSAQPSQLDNPSVTPPLSNLYAQGVLQAPRNILFPAVSTKENKLESGLHHVLDIHTTESNKSSRRIGIISSPSTTSPQPIQEIPVQVTCTENLGALNEEHFVYISNPIYDNEVSRPSRVNTPFETPDSSPSRLETGGSSGEEETTQMSPSSPQSLPITPPLTPMKKLPAEACSVSLRDARSLGTSGSDSVSNNGVSSSSSGSPCTSPSW